MKLLKLNVENITSLKGKHTIDFDALGSHSDLFAITGPTGSGKSSLLTAISLALYGRTVKSNLAAQDYVTVGSPHSHIELEFSLGREQYKAVWHCQLLKKNGEFRSKPKVLRMLTDQNNGQECLIEDLIDLNFSQFNKVAILNQGKFSDFLNASFTERKELLETILNDQTFLLLGRTLKNDIASIQQNIDNVSAQSDHSQLLDHANKKLLKQQLEKLEKDFPLNNDFIDSFTKISLLISKIIDHGKQEAKIEKKVEQYIKEVTQALALLTTKKAIEDKAREVKLKATATLANEKPKLEEALLLKQKTHEHTQQVAHLSLALEKSQKQINEQQQLLDLDKKELLNNKKKFELLSPTTVKNTHDQRLDHLNTFDEYLAISQKLKEMTLRKSEFESNLEQNKLQDQKSLQSLSKKRPHFMANDATSLQLQEMIQIDQQSKAKILLIIKEHEKIDYEYQQLTQKNKKNLESLSDLQKKKSTIQRSLGKEEEEYLPLTQLYLQNQKLKLKLEHYQEILQQQHDVNCPICEQEVTHDKKLDIEKIVTNFDHKSLSSTERRINHLQVSINEFQQSLSIVTKQIIHKEEERKLEEMRLIELVDLIKKNGDVSVDQINNKIKQEEQYLYALQAYNEQVQQRELNHRSLIKKLQIINGEQEHIKQTTKTLFNKLITYSPKLEIERQESELKSYLKIAKQEHVQMTSLSQSEKELQIRTKRAENQIKHLNEQLENHSNELKNVNLQINEIELIYLEKSFPVDPKKIFDELIERQDSSERHYQQCHHEYRNQELAYQKLQSILRTLSEQRDDSKIVYLHYKAQIVPLLAQLPNKISSITINVPELDQSTMSKITLWLNNSDEERNRSLTALESLYIDILTPWLKAASEDLTKQQNQKIIIKTRLEENKKQEDKIAKLLKQKVNLNNQLTKLRELEYYIGKDKFRDYALSVLEKALLDLANYEIGQLADGRYKIIHAKEGKRSEFLIQDEWIGRSQRKVSTLSGGETFMLSLGLSLALSKLNSGGQEIGFFLIDEGFGSLDEESIEEVLECLMNLRSRGKQIGIISHVKSLTSRIPATIELDKNHFGESQVSVTL
jgi:exonuclease SbcC